MDNVSGVDPLVEFGSNRLTLGCTMAGIGGKFASQSSRNPIYVEPGPSEIITAVGGQTGDDRSGGQKTEEPKSDARSGRPAKDTGSMVISSGDDPRTLGAGSGGIEEPTESSGWILSGFDSNGMAVRLNVSEVDLRTDPDGLIVGRSTKKAKLILRDDSVSRAHVRITLGDRLTMEDLESSNGTRINGSTLAVGEKVQIEQGAAIEIGAVRLTLTRS